MLFEYFCAPKCDMYKNVILIRNAALYDLRGRQCIMLSNIIINFYSTLKKSFVEYLILQLSFINDAKI